MNASKNLEIFDKDNQYFTNDKILIIYRLLMQLTLLFDDNLEKDPVIFIEWFKSYFKENSKKGLGDLMKSFINLCDFSDTNIEKLKSITNYYEITELDCGVLGKLCKTTGLIAFFVKDAMVFCGLDGSQEKKLKEERDKFRVSVIKDNIDIKDMKNKCNKILGILDSISTRFKLDY